MRERSKSWTRVVHALAACALLLVGVGACGGSDNGSSGARSGTPATAAPSEPLTVATSWEISSIDPLTEGYWAEVYGYGELLLRPTVTGEPEPWILESAESTSPTEWELTVKDGVTFQNGKPLDADAVAALINHQIAKSPIVKPVIPDARAKATGPTTVRLTTDTPVSNVPQLLTHDDMFPVFDVQAYKTAKGDKEALIGAGIYTGPYEVTELTAERMVLERDDDYWQGRPALPGLEIKFIPDHQARVLAVESGEADMAMYPPTQAARTLQSAHYVTAEKGTNGPRIVLNLDRAPMDDVLVRRALSKAVDYEAIANEVMDGRYHPAKGLFPEHLPFAVNNQEHDPDAARALLDEAGWVDSGEGARTKDGQPLRLTLVTYRSDPDLQPIAVAIRAQLEEVGIAVQIEEIESSSQLYDADFNHWHASLFISGFFGVQGDIVGVIDNYLTSDAAYNVGDIDDARVDEISAELLRTFDQDRRYELLRELQDIVIEQQAYVIVAAEKARPAIVSDEWKDYRPSENYLDIGWQTAP
jgi:peptide/nickel transport system substrate-binding protein